MAIRDSKLPVEWALPRGFQLLSSEDPSRGASLFIRNSIRATKLNLNTNLVAVEVKRIIRTDRSNNKHKSEETRKPQTCGRYGADPEVDLESIDSIWSLPKNSCRVGRRTGGTSPPRLTLRQQSSPSQQSPLPILPRGLLPRRDQTVGIWTLIWDPP
ncbi:hypothetical protein ElyMa_000823500 [Elysia marginata]|uniref:Uncharacterized protein n=1 Tax=Elysia marginata TaxID=1093978 RepID=A0AAV4GYY4_9GAST|nr:hypothetical protein ElyMa_000823500 [Elysia marginata]